MSIPSFNDKYNSLYKDIVISLVNERCPNKIYTKFNPSYSYDLMVLVLLYFLG